MTITYLTLLITKYGYFVLFPLAAIEGPIASLIAGFLVYLGYFQFIPAYAVLILGDLIQTPSTTILGVLVTRKNL